MKQTIFALVDCNNFFVSCERLFRPDLESKPVVVLSSNDGCVVSRSNEAKALGIPMAAPVFKYRGIFERHQVVRFSANFELYADISRRVTDLLLSLAPRLEAYSIDESFLDLGGLNVPDYEAWGRSVCRKIRRHVGVPVAIGIAPSKTLAKLAARQAKRPDKPRDSLSLINKPPEFINSQLGEVAVADVWGVGRRLSPKLRAAGIATALDLAHLPPRQAQQLMGKRGQQIVAELNGTSCYPLEQIRKPPRSIVRTRTFGADTNQSAVIEAALASFVADAAFRLRSSCQLARRVGVFAQTNRHKPGFRCWSRETCLDIPAADTGRLTAVATALFRSFHNSATPYHRAGVYLWDFVTAGHWQADIFGQTDIRAETRSAQRMRALDAINKRYGRRTVRYAAEDLSDAWQPKTIRRSPRYLSDWRELPKAKIHKSGDP